MPISTVEELIEVLKKFPPETVVLKSDFSGSLYTEIDLTDKITYTVMPVYEWGPKSTDFYYQDSIPDNPQSFSAVVL